MSRQRIWARVLMFQGKDQAQARIVSPTAWGSYPWLLPLPTAHAGAFHSGLVISVVSDLCLFFCSQWELYNTNLIFV